MLERLDELEVELAQVESRLADPQVVSNQAELAALARRHKQLDKVVRLGRALRAREADLESAAELARDAEGDERELLRSEVGEIEAEIIRLTNDLRDLLLPDDPNEGRNVILEIHGAEGGEEANLFARDLHDMYVAYADRQGWSVEQLDANPSDLGGFSSVVIVVKGPEAWTRLKYEGGPHRVQRVPVTESQGRVHTSSATVSVLPEAQEVDVRIDPADLDIDVFRSSGPGGQSVNTTDSAVRITHRPTGVVVSMQDEKSQLQNREKALRVLRSRLMKMEQDKAAAEHAAERRDQVRGGGRSEKIRTYTWKENRVKDERLDKPFYNLDRVLAGELDEIVEQLGAAERSRQLEAAS